MNKQPFSRIMALVLSVALVFTMIPFTVSVKAAGCTHEHDTECGYVEGHYVEDDGLENDDLENDLDGEPATSSNTKPTSPSSKGRYVEGAPCQHEHDELCGGLINSGKTPGKSGEESELVVVAEFDELDEYTLYQGFDMGEIESQDEIILPDILTGTDTDDNAITIKGVIWESDPEFDPAVSIEYPGYIFSPVLPEGYVLAAGVTAPEITVFIRPGDLLPQPMASSADIIDLSANNAGTSYPKWSCNSGGSSYIITGNVNIIGTRDSQSRLLLNIASGAKVTYTADLTASVAGSTLGLSGDGTFEMTGGSIANTSMAGRAISVNINAGLQLTVSGGTVLSQGNIGVISAPEDGGSISVTGGQVTGLYDTAIVGGKIIIGGNAKVSSTSGNGVSGTDVSVGGNAEITAGGADCSALSTADTTSTVSISGGTVTATGSGSRALKVFNVALISGGTVQATGSATTAIEVLSPSSPYAAVYITGGVVTGAVKSTLGNNIAYYTGSLGSQISGFTASHKLDSYELYSPAGGSTLYSYSSTPVSSVQATLTRSGRLDLTSAAITAQNAGSVAAPTVGTSTNNSYVTFANDTLDSTNVTITISGAKTRTGSSFGSSTSINLPDIVIGPLSVNIGTPVATPLTFTNSTAYNIPASTVGTLITNIDVSGGVSGGTVAYTFSATDLPDGITISATGLISGTPTTARSAGTATITVTDSLSATASITINYGTISAATLTDITAAAVSITAPVTGATPQNTVAAGTGYTGTISWDNGNPLTFAPSTTYTATVVLTSTAGYQFTPTVSAANITGTNGTVDAPLTSGAGTGNTLTFTVAYPQTTAASSGLTVNGSGTYTTVTTAQAAINNALNSGDVTVGGALHGVSTTLTLNIPTGKTVTWQADYSGSENSMNQLIRLGGEGTFEVAAGSTIEVNGANGFAIYPDNAVGTQMVNVVVSGGTVKAIGTNSYAIRTYNGAVTVSGGTVESTQTALQTTGGDITVSGSGTAVTSTTGTAISTGGGLITINGGAVKAEGNKNAIFISSGNTGRVKVTGGTVLSAGRAVSLFGSGDVEVSGGTVETTGTQAAIYTAASNVTVSGGTVQAIETGGTSNVTVSEASGAPTLIRSAVSSGRAINTSNGNVTVTGGAVKAEGNNGTAIFTNSGLISVTGGSFSATGSGGRAIGIDSYGAAAYLQSTYGGGSFTATNGMIVEADSLTISRTRNGVSTGLTTKAGGSAAVWDTTGSTPEIKFTLTDTSTKTLAWGVFRPQANAPSAPTVASNASTSITLNTITNAEYRLSTNPAGWQDSPTFTGLTPDTDYTFYARIRETATDDASPESTVSAAIRTSKATLTGTVTISGSSAFGQTLTAVTTGLSSNPSVTLGTLSYQWKRSGTDIGGAAGSTYVLTQDDIGQTITVTVTAANCDGNVTSPATGTVTKVTQAAPSAPSEAIGSTTAVSITLSTITGAEYSRSASGPWQSSPTFSGLTPNTGYSFYARLAETATHSASPASAASALITTAKATLGGTVTITGSAVYGETLAVNITGLNTEPAGANMGTLSYQWKRGGMPITGANGATYIIVTADIGQSISVTVTASNCTGEVSDTTATVAKRTPTPADLEYDLTAVDYNGSPHSVTVTPKAGVTGFGTVTVKYNNSTAVPTDAGTYAITVSVAGGDNYAATTTDISLGNFIISRHAPTAALLDYTLPATVNYDGGQKSVSVTPKNTVMGLGTVTVYYEGTSGTAYTKSSNAPTNAGTYFITVRIAGGTNYTATTSDISLGNFTINGIDIPAGDITVTPYDAAYDGSAHGISVVDNVGSGTVTYCETQGGTYTSINPTYTNVGMYTVYFKVTRSSNNFHVYSGSGTVTITKATPAAPTVTGTMTNDRQTYTYTVTAPASGALYKMDGGSWRTSPVFSGITPGVGVTHTFYAKLTETATHHESPEGNTGTLSFSRLPQNPPVITYTRSGDPDNGGVTVTVTSPATGATYSTDGLAYHTTNPIAFAQGVSSATIYVRLDATATHEQSAAASVYIDFTKQDQAAPDAFVLGYSANGDTDYTVTIPATAGAEYSFDGQTWSGIYTRTNCHPGDIITGYKRMAETSALNASTATIASVTLPVFQVKTPTAMPNGGNFTTSQNVTLSCATTGADIYYTTDSTTPTTGSTLYSGAFTITDTTTVKAIAVKAGMTGSEVLTVTFTNSPVLSSDAALSALVISSGTLTPAFNPAATSYTATVAYSVSSVTVTATANHANATVSGAGTKALVVGANTITITVTAQDGTAKTYTITITREGSGSSNGGGGGSSSSGSSSSPRYNITTAKQHGMPKVATMTYTGTVQDNQLTCTITKDMVQADVNAAGTDPDGIALTFIITNSSSYHNQTISIAGDALDLLRSSGMKYVQVQTGIFRFHFDSAAISSLDSQTTGTVTVSAYPVSPLSDAANAAIGSRPVFDFTVHDSTGSTVTSYGSGTVTRGIRYTAADTEHTGSLFIVKIVDGTVQWIDRSSYDNGWMIWSGDSNSVYGVGYKAPAPAFTDTTGHWAKDDIDFAASRGLISGTGVTAFSPDTAITRADFLMALGRLSGADVSGYTTGSFTDVPAANPAMPYIEWAVANNIVQGIGDSSFGPDHHITREQMAVIMVNYAEATNYPLPVSRLAVTFADDAAISAYAKEAVKAIQQTGVISGKADNRFDPQGSVTRAEAGTILRRFTKLGIDGNTARGWVRNDIGQWQYITPDGRTVTGWLNTASGIWYWFDDKGIMAAGEWVQIGGRWYYFYDDGQMAANTTIDGYEVGADGARKE